MIRFNYLPFLLLMMATGWGGNPLNADDLGKATIKQFDGTEFESAIQSIDPNGSVTGIDVPANLNLRDVVGIETGRAIERRGVYSSTLYLVDGSQLFVRNPEIVGEKVTFRTANGLSEIPLSILRAIVWTPSPTIEARIKDPSTDQDSVFVQTADVERSVEGIVERLDREQLTINYQNESRKIGLEKIKALVMADLGLAESTGPIATIQLTDGSTVVGVILDLVAGKLAVAMAGNNQIALDADRIASVKIKSDRLLFLSDLEPIDVQQKTEFTVLRTWQRDRSVEQNPLTIRYGDTEKIVRFNRGLGTQAFTQLVFENPGKFDRFNAIAGIDAETEGRGDCQMVVRGDGIELWSKRVRGSGEPQEIDVDISGIKRVSLIVYPGEDFDLADHADWCNARFVKTK